MVSILLGLHAICLSGEIESGDRFEIWERQS